MHCGRFLGALVLATGSLTAAAAFAAAPPGAVPAEPVTPEASPWTGASSS